jgi:hypothetical protein
VAAPTTSRRALTGTFVAFLAALLPGVYGLQLIMDQTLGTDVWLEGSVLVRIAGQSPLKLELILKPNPLVQEGVEFQGVARLHQPDYPWEATDFSGGIWLRFEPGFLAGTSAPGVTGWSAAYTVGDKDGKPTRSPVPCKGRLDVTENTRRAGSPDQPWTEHGSLALSLSMTCSFPGPDRRWATGDDLTWHLEGDLAMRKGRRPAASTPL